MQDKKQGGNVQKRYSIIGKEDIMPISGPRALCKEAEFPPMFILMPGFKVQGAGKSKVFEGFIKGQSGRIREIKKVPVAYASHKMQ